MVSLLLSVHHIRDDVFLHALFVSFPSKRLVAGTEVDCTALGTVGAVQQSTVPSAVLDEFCVFATSGSVVAYQSADCSHAVLVEFLPRHSPEQSFPGQVLCQQIVNYRHHLVHSHLHHFMVSAQSNGKSHLQGAGPVRCVIILAGTTQFTMGLINTLCCCCSCLVWHSTPPSYHISSIWWCSCVPHSPSCVRCPTSMCASNCKHSWCSLCWPSSCWQFCWRATRPPTPYWSARWRTCNCYRSHTFQVRQPLSCPSSPSWTYTFVPVPTTTGHH